MRGCKAACVEDFQAIMEFTGWSQSTVFALFFIAIFLLLLLVVFVLYKFRPKRYRYRSRKRSRKRASRAKRNNK